MLSDELSSVYLKKTTGVGFKGIYLLFSPASFMLS